MAKRPIIERDALGPKPPTEAKPKKWKASSGTNPMVGARVDPQLREDFVKIAKSEGLHTSSLLRWLIREFIKDHQAGRVELPKKPSQPKARYTLD